MLLILPAIAQEMKDNPRLKTVYLTDMNILTEEARALGEGLKNAGISQFTEFHMNNIMVEHEDAVSELLPDCPET